jgi:hypothetical protein
VRRSKDHDPVASGTGGPRGPRQSQANVAPGPAQILGALPEGGTSHYAPITRVVAEEGRYYREAIDGFLIREW